jgi:hypothetical protein
MRIKPATLLLTLCVLAFALPVETALADGKAGWDRDWWGYDGARYQHHHRHHKGTWYGHDVVRAWPRRSVSVYRVGPRYDGPRIAGRTIVYRDRWR